jgi:hypothetical protein
MVLQAPLAFAAPLPQVIGAFNGVFFRNSEVLLDNDQDGQVSVGDVFWGVMNVNQIVAPTTNDGQTGPQIWPGVAPLEITAYFATEVLDVFAPGTAAPPNHPISAASATVATIILGPPEAGDPNNILAPGEVLRVFEDPAINYNDATQGSALATATNGSLLWSFGIDGGYWYTLAPTAVPGSGDVGESFAGLHVIIDSGDLFGLVNDPNEDYSSDAQVAGGLNVNIWFNSEIFRLVTNPGLTVDPAAPMHFGSNDPAVYFPQNELERGACRMTGGNATVSPAIAYDDTETWAYDFVEPADQNYATGYWITTGGQINAPSGNTPPSGHWVHAQHGGAEGNFSFHAGTSSAPDGTEISTVECADPGWCVQARCAGFKQLFWTGIGNFANQHFDAVFPGCDVVPTRGNVGTQHFVRVMIGDFGENDRPTREAALQDADPDSCNWFDKLQGAGYPGPPGPYTAADAVFLDSVPDGKFGDKGGQVCDKCPDYYQIEIHCTTDPASAVIYDFEGFLESGNYQIHPETGTQCPVTEELVPELFETTTTKGNGKKN